MPDIKECWCTGAGRPIIKELAAGKTSLRAIAEGLNAQGIPTARGEGEWTATQVMRVLERLDPFEAAA